MTIADKLSQILDIKEDIKDALIEKGSDVTDDTPFAEYPEKIQEISTSDGSNITIEFDDVFFDTRTLNASDYESLFKDYKGTSLDLMFMSKEFTENMNGMFTDCINLETLNLSKWFITDAALTGNMFINVPSLNKVIMNYTDFISAKKILDELPDYTGAENGDYIFEVEEPNTVHTKLVQELGPIYKGWTISKGENKDYKIVAFKNSREATAAVCGLTSDFLVNRTTTFGDNYGEYIETSYLPKDPEINNYNGTFTIIDGYVIDANEALNQFKTMKVQITTTENSMFDTISIPEIIGDYDFSNATYLNFYFSKNAADKSIYITDHKYLKNINYLRIIDEEYYFANSNWTDTYRLKDIVIENINFDNVKHIEFATQVDNMRFSNVSFNNLEHFKFVMYIDSGGYYKKKPSLDTVIFDNVNLPMVSDISNAFFDCRDLDELDLSSVHFSTTKTFTANNAFKNCVNLHTLNLSNISPTMVPETPSNALLGCGSLYNLVMANCPWYFVEYIMSSTEKLDLQMGGTLYCDMDMSSIVPSGWSWKHSSEYNG